MSAGEDLAIETPNDRFQDAHQVVRLHAATVPGSMDEKAGAALPVLIGLYQTGDQDRILAFFPWARSPRLLKSGFPALFAVDDDEDDLEEDDLEKDEDDLDEDLGDEDLGDEDLGDDDDEDEDLDGEDEDDEEEDLDEGDAEIDDR